MRTKITHYLLTFAILSCAFLFTNTTAAHAQYRGSTTCTVTAIEVTLNPDIDVSIDDINEVYGTGTLHSPSEWEIASGQGAYLLWVGSDAAPATVIWQMNLDVRILDAQAYCDSGSQTEGGPSYGW